MATEFQKASEAVAHIRAQIVDAAPEVGVICGSGLGGFADKIEGAHVLATAEIPHFRSSTVAGHAGKLVYGTVGDKHVLAVQGRLHTYEGYSIQDTVLIVRVLALLGAKVLVVTNAAGGVNAEYQVGDLMVISDHLNVPGMTGTNPLRGPNESGFGGPRFLATNDLYPHDLRHQLFQIVDNPEKRRLQRQVHEGVYTMLTGPTYESSAEVRLVRQWGGDAVGMSSVPEAIVAGHSGMRVLGLSLITNSAIGTPPRSGRLPPTSEKVEEPDHEEVVAVAAQAAQDVEYLVVEFIKQL